MKRIFDPALLNFYLQKHEIPSLFDTPDLAFSLYQFEKGERLDTLNPEEYLSFLVDGSIEISANRADETMKLLEANGEAAYVLGNIVKNTGTDVELV